MNLRRNTFLSTRLLLSSPIVLLLVAGCMRTANNPPASNLNAALQVGDPAPPLSLSSYVTGQPLTSGLEGKIHVIEFWATWCPPCRASMPHLSGLQTQYGDDVVFVGVTNEDVGTVESFLQKPSPEGAPWSEVITYRLATDAGQATSTAYMKAAGQTGIPTAFIVDAEGIIRWIGHPLDIDAPLDRLVGENQTSTAT